MSRVRQHRSPRDETVKSEDDLSGCFGSSLFQPGRDEAPPDSVPLSGGSDPTPSGPDGRRVTEEGGETARREQERWATAHDNIYRYACRILKNPEKALDAAQTAILKAVKKLEKLKDHSKFYAWTKRIGIRTVLGWYRDRKNSCVAAGQDESCIEKEDPSPGPVERLSGDELLGLARRVLTEEEFEVVGMRIDGLSFPEIASELGLPLWRIKRLWADAKEELQGHL